MNSRGGAALPTKLFAGRVGTSVGRARRICTSSLIEVQHCITRGRSVSWRDHAISGTGFFRDDSASSRATTRGRGAVRLAQLGGTKAVG